jgi:hypothetical protein
MNSAQMCQRGVQVRVIKGALKGITGLLSGSTQRGVYVIWGDPSIRPLVYGPFSPDEVEIVHDPG